MLSSSIEKRRGIEFWVREKEVSERVFCTFVHANSDDEDGYAESEPSDRSFAVERFVDLLKARDGSGDEAQDAEAY